MRFSGHYLVLCLALVLCLQFAVAAPHAAVRRQDDTPSAESTREPQDSASRQPSATPTPSGIISSSIESERPSSTEASSVKISETPAPSSINDVPTTTPSDDATPAESSGKLYGDKYREDVANAAIQRVPPRIQKTHCQFTPS